ncbi:YybH family protein [Hymenobacter jejuensis]|uniref:Nuclear transport factor 2 family protein n=1 Tax=Hymenobacter jejuensis TaxID=2502781 RepID=A0A5B7ZW48_9BACT|nr:nuclear transport factor 2 family protein [Hymenobacter jejuensis]QDA59198.1 nuclear transport factor 2 family protein [Hymenobacter jejuensis]
MIKNYSALLLLIAVLCSLSHLSYGQISKQKHLELLKARSETWNKAFNSRDTTALAGLFSAQVTLSNANGSRVGAAENMRNFQALFRLRPDIAWMNRTQFTEIDDQWQVAYETGEWNESWTNTQDQSKTRITGKYWLMWKYENNRWAILSGIFTPLTCGGGHCKE